MPMKISARLLPAIEIESTWISIEPTGKANHWNGNGKPQWRWYIDLPDGREYTDDGFYGWGNAGEVMESLLGFLGAFAESFPDGDNANLFPSELGEWAQLHSDDLTMLEVALAEKE